jgi:hypothetical protein
MISPLPRFVGVLGIVALASARLVAQTPVASGMIAWWPANGSAQDIAGTNHGTVVGTTFAAGRVGQAFNFNGTSNYVLMPDSSLWAFGTRDFTIELWAKFELAGSRALVASDEGSGGNPKWIFWLDGGFLRFHINAAFGSANIGSAAFSPALGDWYHLAVTRAASTYRFYINGEVVATNSSSLALPDANAPLTIGSAENNFFFKGQLDEISIYSRSLSPSEIKAIHDAGSAGKSGASVGVPIVTQQPVAQATTVGGTVTFSVSGSGAATVSYQWFKDGVAVAGGTNAMLTLTNVQSGQAGSYSVVLSNSLGSASSTSAPLSVGAPATPPVIVAQPADRAASVGANVTFEVAVGGTPPFTYQWRKDGAAIPGAASSSLVLTGITAISTGSYTVLVTNSAGSASTTPALLTVSSGPIITTQPLDQSVALGGNTSLVVVAAGSGGLVYQWVKDGRPVAGANNPTLPLSNVTNADAGAYSVTIANSAGAVTSRIATLMVSAAASRLANLSIRTNAGSGTQTVIVGFVVAGEPASKAVLVRGIGPSLTAFGVSGAMADPQLTLFSGNVQVATNDNWGDSPTAEQISQVSRTVGAFTLDPRSRDAAMHSGLQPGSYTVQLVARGAAGIGLVELYDTDANPYTRLVNVSARCQVGTGSGILIAGFVVQGNSQKTILLRAVGPTLTALGVTGVLADPQIALLRNTDVLASNDDWWRGDGAQILPGLFNSVGAFSLATNSRDAALVATVQPGQYNVQVVGAAGSTGVALVEIYEVP